MFSFLFNSHLSLNTTFPHVIPSFSLQFHFFHFVVPNPLSSHSQFPTCFPVTGHDYFPRSLFSTHSLRSFSVLILFCSLCSPLAPHVTCHWLCGLLLSPSPYTQFFLKLLTNIVRFFVVTVALVSPSLLYWFSFLSVLDNLLVLLLASVYYIVGFFTCPPVLFTFYDYPRQIHTSSLLMW